MIGRLVNWITGGGVAAINEGVKTVFGSKAMRDQYQANENAATMQQFATEFQDKSNRTWFDSIIDGVNRLPRPVIAFSVFYMFYLSYADPAMFAVIAAGWTLIPEQMWQLAFIIVTFFFMSRTVEKLPVFTRVNNSQVKEIVDNAKRVIALKESLENRAVDETKADENPSIEAWKNRADTL